MQWTLFKKDVLGSIFGNILEWYDFVLFGSLAPFIAIHFFPAKDNLTSLMMTFSVFAVGFLARPLGGILFSHFGDTRGRRKTLLTSIVVMTFPTILIGLIPGYNAIGIICPIAILCIRILQGFAVGGEFVGSMSYMIESAKKNERGYYSSLVQLGLFSGVLIGPVVIKIVMLFTTTLAFSEWGWRIPFLCSAPLGIIAYYLCRRISESKIFLEEKKKTFIKIPLLVCFRKYKNMMFIAFMLSAQVGIAFWLVIVYSITYFSKILHMPFSIVETQNLLAVVASLILILIIGKLTRYISSWMLLLISSIALFIFACFLNMVLIRYVGSWLFYLAYFFMLLFSIAYLCGFSDVIASLFPVEIRYSGIAFSYNCSIAIFGGLTPLVVTALIKQSVLLAPGLLLMFGSLLSLIALLLAKKHMRY